jgi:thioredoxin 1
VLPKENRVGENMQDLTQENYSETIKSGKVIIDCWAPWCGPCKMFSPIFEETANEVEGVTFVKLNTEDAPELAGELGIRSIPTLIFFNDGEEVGRLSGAMQKEDFKAKIKEILG